MKWITPVEQSHRTLMNFLPGSGLSSVIFMMTPLKTVLVEVDVSKPEVHLPLHVHQQLFNTGPLLLLGLLVLTAEFRIRSVPLRVGHPAAVTQIQLCDFALCKVQEVLDGIVIHLGERFVADIHLQCLWSHSKGQRRVLLLKQAVQMVQDVGPTLTQRCKVLDDPLTIVVHFVLTAAQPHLP
ncbi:hypothetical protein EYF80_005802 [Liparis tanakae]|uniref:Uncharacterized protein n=1 Tax=Liparis tanakae TaxID=230148 RepID=A0A4Z2J1V7_9TELE|nr:hypothetical protein EYF80_005802 [Liparis tanakae]